MTLVDTSVWIDHLRTGNDRLRVLLDSGGVLMHPFVVGELACGNLTNRGEVLGLLKALPQCPVAMDDEVLTYIERQALMGRGIGYIDVHLLAAVALEEEKWTLDETATTAKYDADLLSVEEWDEFSDELEAFRVESKTREVSLLTAYLAYREVLGMDLNWEEWLP